MWVCNVWLWKINFPIQIDYVTHSFVLMELSHLAGLWIFPQLIDSSDDSYIVIVHIIYRKATNSCHFGGEILGAIKL